MIIIQIVYIQYVYRHDFTLYGEPHGIPIGSLLIHFSMSSTLENKCYGIVIRSIFHGEGMASK